MFLSILRCLLISFQMLIKLLALKQKRKKHRKMCVMWTAGKSAAAQRGMWFPHALLTQTQHTLTHMSLSGLVLIKLWRWSLGKPSSALHRHTQIHRCSRWWLHTDWYLTSVSELLHDYIQWNKHTLLEIIISWFRFRRSRHHVTFTHPVDEPLLA